MTTSRFHAVQAQAKPVPTSPENMARIHAMYDQTKTTLGILYMRWLDEREYEDINEYGRIIAGKLPEGFTMVKMSKAPFGFKFNIGTEAEYFMTTNLTTVKWKRTK